MPNVSVIVPNYNHERFLRERLQSVIEQDYGDFEVILLDDKSQDNSKLVLEEFAAHPKVSHLVINTDNSGSPFSQWKRGLALASADLIWIAESDDVAAPNFLTNMMALFAAEPEMNLAFCRSVRIGESGQSEGFNQWGEAINPERWSTTFVNDGNRELADYLIHRNTIPNASAVIFRKSVALAHIDKICDYKYCGDWLFWNLLAKDSKVGYRGDTHNYFRRYESATSLKRSAERLRQRFLEYRRVIETTLAVLSKEYSGELQHQWMVDEWLVNKKELPLLDFLTPNFPLPLRLRFYKTFIASMFR